MSCSERAKERVVTPWGDTLGDSIPDDGSFTLSDIVNNGEIIMLTLSGPDTYYDYHGRGMGAQYLLCEKFAQSIGVSLRVDVCKDTTEMINRVCNGDGDIIAFMLTENAGYKKHLSFCGAGEKGAHWAVRKDNRELAEALNRWFKPAMLSDIRREEKRLLSSGSVRRHVYAPFIDRSAGVISRYDPLFKKYAPMARWDWRLMAAQCYQESCFDPDARSWAGACGLMQIMPSTASSLGLPMSQIHEPEPNIAASAKFTAQLMTKFSDIPNVVERQRFVLAAYNCGPLHVRDAMALTRKHGGDEHRWADVSRNMLLLRDPKYYNDPVVKYGYMRSNETVDYVERICQRYAQYRGVPVGKGSGGGYSPVEPRRAKKKHKYSRL